MKFQLLRYDLRAIAMTKTTIHQVIGIQGITLVVFYSKAHCWQFRLISSAGAVFGESKLYYSSEAAERAGRDWRLCCKNAYQQVVE